MQRVYYNWSDSDNSECMRAMSFFTNNKVKQNLEHRYYEVVDENNHVKIVNQLTYYLCQNVHVMIKQNAVIF
jgi:hypothetical protein